MSAVGVVGKVVVVVASVKMMGDAPLFFIAYAKRSIGLRLGSAQSGQQHAGKDGDDRYDYQQFDKGKSDSRGKGRGGFVKQEVCRFHKRFWKISATRNKRR